MLLNFLFPVSDIFIVITVHLCCFCHARIQLKQLYRIILKNCELLNKVIRWAVYYNITDNCQQCYSIRPI